MRVATVKSGVEAPLKRRGTVQADTRLRLGFKLPGVLAAVLVKEGDRVREGQQLARLDQTDALGQARVAGAGRNKASRDWKKAQQLFNEGAVAEGLRDDARSGLEAADANLSLALANLKRTKLTSPVNGTVVQRLAEPGESVGAGVPVLLIDETDRPVVRVGIADRDLPKVTEGAYFMQDGQKVRTLN